MIPALAHFIWFGRQLPWVHALSIISAARRGAFERVILHHADDLSQTKVWPELLALPNFEARPLAVAELFAALEGGKQLAEIYALLEAPAARANLLRAAILLRDGGVYLDLDTITLRPIDDLRATLGAFCGEERVIWSAAIKRRRELGLRLANLGRAGVRELHRLHPDGWRSFRRVESWYPTAANNAVLAAAPGHPFVQRLLANMIALPHERRLVRYALGTHLLQDTLAEAREADVRVLPPSWFYPLGPEISHHWFRLRRRVPALDEVLDADTRIVHWYASVRTREWIPRIDPSYVRAHADRQLFAALALPLLDAA